MSASVISKTDETQPLLANNKTLDYNQQRSQSWSRGYNAWGGNQTLHESDQYLLNDALYPTDAFEHQTYWADLSVEDKACWIKHHANNEIRREYEVVVKLARASVLEPLQAYCSKYALPGVGFFVEGYVLFSVGNIMPLFKASWPECWAENQQCDAQSIKAVKYMEILGIICGQIAIGFYGDFIGRRWGLIQDACTMLLGTIMLASMWGTSLQGWVAMYTVSIFIFGVGVGGEYPMTSTSSIEGLKGKEDRGHRGRAACLAFLMQGWGQLFNQLILILLIIITSPSHSLQPPYTKLQTQITFRVTFLIASLCLLYFIYLRVFRMKDTDEKVRENRQSRGRSSGYDWESLKFVLSHFWGRLLATSVCWFCSDFAFYGMQIFRNELLELVTGTSSRQVDTIWLYNLINIMCQLAGYYLAALLIDYKAYGRRKMQIVGFGVQFLLYTTVAVIFPLLNQRGTGAKVFQAIFFLANFWVQFGPNSTTFLIAAEVYPVGVRSTAHGFSAAMGKVGALTATVSFNYLSSRNKFIILACFMLLGLVLTFTFVPDVTGLDLAEMQRAWRFIADGETTDYHGIAVHPQHLSWFEQHVRRRHENYDIQYDRNQRIAELRKSYMKSSTEVAEANNEGGEIDQNLVKYFELERSGRQQD